MTNSIKQMLLMGLVVSLVVGCSQSTTKPTDETAPASTAAELAEPKSFYQNEKNRPVDTLVITARGWGAPPKQYYPEGNRRLMAMRAAKLDAYRSLAERIHGLRIWGGTTVGEMVLEQDQFKVLLDAYVVGAKVLSIMPQKDGNYEAIVEVEVGRDFLYRALASRNDLMTVPSGYSALPKTAYEEQATQVQQHEAVEDVVSESHSQANFYFAD
ncbi:MAG: LPP20 family lipoprotein [Gammaproteobacteria bacterium]|nr:LPP20 family lipoprotein [Gammaproteobacteria bacterium]MCF6229993.1 LPP20 family lipoprotein [Gammaproteobacteria bacterium]